MTTKPVAESANALPMSALLTAEPPIEPYASVDRHSPGGAIVGGHAIELRRGLDGSPQGLCPGSNAPVRLGRSCSR